MPEGDAIFDDDALPDEMRYDSDDLKSDRDEHDEEESE